MNPSSVRGYVGFYLIKDLHSAYLHAIPTRDKTAATYRATLALAIDFYQTHGHRVLKVRSDSGSAENALESAEFLSQFNIITDTAAPDEQQQNPVEREMQTLKKGVSALLIDQTALGPSWWCYAVESWVSTSNATPRGGNTLSPIEIVTSVADDISVKFQFPFGFPVNVHKIEGRGTTFDTVGEIGIAVGCSNGSNRATLVVIPAWSRYYTL